ncbi:MULTISPECIES: hypothetical protein [Chitinophaga]|uniref:hypothetical protein n=1 Tax=Chitinophaga TaxID=79328 RepID=UPI001455BA56|nr:MULTISPECIES: hypothetical protein [Chitinophaga]NLU92319.1 hypothetical protein [Chitinophaga sp. Ak27]
MKNIVVKDTSVLRFFMLCFLSMSCNSYTKPTPEKYKYINRYFSSNDYTEDSIYIVGVLNKILEQNVGPFSAKKAYNIKATSIYLDSILYAPDKKGMVILFITKTDKEKIEYYGDDTTRYFYSANYLFGLKDSISNNIKLFDYGAIRFINFNNYEKAKDALFEYCFGRRATDRPWNNHEPMYNMDDVRFWKGEQFNEIKSDTSFIHLK